jgi:hypothetical protein
VDIDVRFGYPISDDKGNVTFGFGNPKSELEPSAVGWVEVFPKSFTLQPGESQTVVMTVTPPPALAEGEYWARPVITFQPDTKDSDRGTDSPDVERSQLVLSLNYRHGFVNTGIVVEKISVQQGGRAIRVIVPTTRRGNSAFIGNLVCRLRALDGSVVAQEKREVAVYHSLAHGIDLDVANLKEGYYVAEVELNTDRRGNRDGDIIQCSTTVGKSEAVRIKGLVGTTSAGPIVDRSQSKSAEPVIDDILPGVRPSQNATAKFDRRNKAIRETLEKLHAMQVALDKMLNEMKAMASLQGGF